MNKTEERAKEAHDSILENSNGSWSDMITEGIEEGIKIGQSIAGATEAQDDWKRVEEIRKAFAEYRATEGCSCCQDIDGHKEAEKKLAELLHPKPYDDLSGWDWDLPSPPSNYKKESA